MGFVSVSVDDGIATILLDRPPMNATTPAVVAEIRDAFLGIPHRKDVNVVIFTAAGEKAFMVGADLKAELATESENGDAPPDESASFRTQQQVGQEAMWAVYSCPVPVIGAINGAAIGGGFAFAALCDFVVAAD